MNKMDLTALLIGATLFTGLGVTTASADGSKCGVGKCGDAKPAKSVTKCGAEKKAKMKVTKCGDGKKDKSKPASKCGGNK